MEAGKYLNVKIYDQKEINGAFSLVPPYGEIKPSEEDRQYMARAGGENILTVYYWVMWDILFLRLFRLFFRRARVVSVGASSHQQVPYVKKELAKLCAAGHTVWVSRLL